MSAIKGMDDEKKRKRELLIDTIISSIMVILFFIGFDIIIESTQESIVLLYFGIAIQLFGFYSIYEGNTKIGLTLSMVGTDIIICMMVILW